MKKVLLVMLMVLLTAAYAFCDEFEDVLNMAEQGDTEAQVRLGLMYTNGQGVTQDFKQAVFWYKKAAEQGHPGAQHNLGVVYAKGQGLEQNLQLAYVWSCLAASQGKGINNRDVIAKMLTPEQLSKAQDEAAKMQSQIDERIKPAKE